MRPSRSTQLLCSRLLSRDVAAVRQCSFRPSSLVAAASAKHTSIRTFSNTTATLKKGGKAAREASRSDSSSSSSSAPAAVGSEDPFDFSALESDINDAVEKLKADLSQLRQGGRFNPQVLESLRVQLKQGGPVKLGDLAQVVPKGRVIQVVVGEQEHLKPISSSIQSANLNLTPQPDPTGANPLLLNIPIPPPTAESRKATVNAAAKAGDVASNAVRNARQGQQKKLRAMQLAKTARPDDLKKAGVQMEKVVEKGVGEVKKIVDGAKKALDA
ncbi:ribosome recycling factor [Aureobasidium pullulans]|uniref:Ribosome recycling factor n=1 Tax=Aureobasidium pullulans TaxID=5580 RepID=A0A4S8VMB3_AURPU|nr:ribosome recycling factor [Aureobasidium pullulans]THY48223.1 ribosome recycling factor [Aureobasidium pullulans]